MVKDDLQVSLNIATESTGGDELFKVVEAIIAERTAEKQAVSHMEPYMTD